MHVFPQVRQGLVSAKLAATGGAASTFHSTWASLTTEQVAERLEGAQRRRKELSSKMAPEQWEREQK
jgi:hypothetical protein